MKKKFKIIYGYQHVYDCGEKKKQKNKATTAAINKIENIINNYIEYKGLDIELDILHYKFKDDNKVGITTKINECQLAILDISLKNRDLLVGLGIASAKSERGNKNFSVYLIKNNEHLNCCFDSNNCVLKNWFYESDIKSFMSSFLIYNFKFKDNFLDLFFENEISLFVKIMADIINYINNNESENISIDQTDIIKDVKYIIGQTIK
jgi:hypothetical protein